jgi:hypothetical protein
MFCRSREHDMLADLRDAYLAVEAALFVASCAPQMVLTSSIVSGAGQKPRARGRLSALSRY